MEKIKYEQANAHKRWRKGHERGTQCIIGILRGKGSHWPRGRSFMEHIQLCLCLKGAKAPMAKRPGGSSCGRGVDTHVGDSEWFTAPWWRGGWAGHLGVE